jgi:hypothetical protein
VPGEFAISPGQDGTDSTRTQGIKREKKFRSNFGTIQEGDCATFSAVSDRCSTYLIFTAFLTAECSLFILLQQKHSRYDLSVGSRMLNVLHQFRFLAVTHRSRSRTFRARGTRTVTIIARSTTPGTFTLMGNDDQLGAHSALADRLLASQYGLDYIMDSMP